MKKSIFLFAAFLALANFVFAQAEDSNSPEKEKTSPHAFTVIADLAFYPNSDPVVSDQMHFAPVSQPGLGIGPRLTARYEYTIPVPFAQNILFSSNTLKLCADLEAAPVTIGTKLFTTFSPIAFLVFEAGAKVSTGWDLLGSHGLAVFDDKTGDYESLTPFKNWFYQFNFMGTFQFDVAALWPGDWHHIVMTASYELHYWGITGVDDKAPWCWQTNPERVNGLGYYANVILGYQMPMKFSMFGAQFEWSGVFSNDQFNKKYSDFNGAFCEYSLNPFVVFSITKNDQIFSACYIKTRRGFDSKKKTVNGRDQHILEMNYSSPEWFVHSIGFRYIHKF